MKKKLLIWCLKTLALVIVDDYLLLLPAVCKAEFPSDLLFFNLYVLASTLSFININIIELQQWKQSKSPYGGGVGWKKYVLQGGGVSQIVGTPQLIFRKSQNFY